MASDSVEDPTVCRAQASVGRIEATANAYPAAGNIMGAPGTKVKVSEFLCLTDGYTFCNRN